MAAAGLTWWFDAILLHRVANGTDHGTRLAAILTYVGVDGSYTLARALGLTALVFAYVTVMLGLVPLLRAGGPTGVLGALHRQVGAVTIALVAAHATVPYTSAVPPYGGWRTALVPFGQPVSWGLKAAAWESLGILALYLLVLTAPTYWLVRRRRRAWAAAHHLTAAIYGLAVAHAFLLGTDFMVSGPLRVVLLAAQIPLLALLAIRLAPDSAPAENLCAVAGSLTPGLIPSTGKGNIAEVNGRGTRPLPGATLRWLCAALVGLASAGMAALTFLTATGEYAPGMRL